MKLGIFILPKNQLLKAINFHKKKIKKIYGYQPYLLHPAHCTIYVFNTNKTNLEQIKKIQNIKFKKKLNIRVNKLDFFYEDILTGKDTIFFRVNQNMQLNLFQKKIVKIFSIYISGKNKFIKFSDKNMQRNYDKYGYPFVNKNWMPHFTIASIKNKFINDLYFKKLFDKKCKYNVDISKVYIYKIIHDKHELISSINIVDR